MGTITTETGAWLPFLLQTADPLFPTGAYAHSLGAEEMTRLGVLRDEASLLDFLRMHTMPMLEQQELPYLRFALGSAQLRRDDSVGAVRGLGSTGVPPGGQRNARPHRFVNDMRHVGDSAGRRAEQAGRLCYPSRSDAPPQLFQLCELDREIDAWKLAHETREASVQIGVRRLRALANICSGSPLLADFAREVEQGAARGHHLIVFSLQAGVESIPRDAALMTWAYQALAAVCAAALKLIRIGQDAIQRTLRAACADLPRLVEKSCVVMHEDAGCFSPMLEIASMRHERAFERLFIS